MKVVAYPSDDFGCGHHRIIWPAQALQAQGHDVTIVRAQDRHIRLAFGDYGELRDVQLEGDFDVVIFQRITSGRMVQAITKLREKGIAVVVDVDDDLSSIHPSNPAWTMLNPNRAKHETEIAARAGMFKSQAHMDAYRAEREKRYDHSWNHLHEVCRRATLVTVSTPELLRRYAAHGRGVVLPNLTPDHYLAVPHEDSDLIGWPATLASHPNDPHALGNALARVMQDGARFATAGGNDQAQMKIAFGLPREPEDMVAGEIDTWPDVVTLLGLAVAPLADTRFNAAKSWLKPLECAAVGVPVIMSPRAEYTRLHKLGIGILAEKPRDWYRALRSLLDDVPRRLDASLAGREAARGLAVSTNAWKHWEAWDKSLNIQLHGDKKGGQAPKRLTPAVT